MLDKAWNCKGEMPFCFPRSSIKFQGHTGQNITDFDPNWPFPDYRPVAAFKSLRFALFHITGHFFRGIHRSRVNSLHKVPATRRFDVFFDLRLNKWLNKQLWVWWFETPLRSLWRHCNDKFEFPVCIIKFSYEVDETIWSIGIIASDNDFKWRLNQLKAFYQYVKNLICKCKCSFCDCQQYLMTNR